ncbi:hypothetical protein HYZ98_01780, partial [Candidatus Peregrinibacteria bacterium]|nr:hypothetical protein [Candidatus Peregrinibacteria bacterium]
MLPDPKQTLSLDEVRSLLQKGNTIPEIDFSSREEKIQWVQEFLGGVGYEKLSREDKGLTREYLQKVTGYSRAQVARHITNFVRQPLRVIESEAQTRNVFPRLTTASLITLITLSIAGSHFNPKGALVFHSGELQTTVEEFTPRTLQPSGEFSISTTEGTTHLKIGKNGKILLPDFIQNLLSASLPRPVIQQTIITSAIPTENGPPQLQPLFTQEDTFINQQPGSVSVQRTLKPSTQERSWKRRLTRFLNNEFTQPIDNNNIPQKEPVIQDTPSQHTDTKQKIIAQKSLIASLLENRWTRRLDRIFSWRIKENQPQSSVAQNQPSKSSSEPQSEPSINTIVYSPSPSAETTVHHEYSLEGLGMGREGQILMVEDGKLIWKYLPPMVVRVHSSADERDTGTGRLPPERRSGGGDERRYGGDGGTPQNADGKIETHSHDTDVEGGAISILNATNGILTAERGGTGFDRYSTGALLVGTALGKLTTLSVGGAGQVLTVSNGTAAWADAGGGMNFAESSSYFIDDTGDTMTGALIITATNVGLEITNTASGRILHAQDLLTSSGFLIVDEDVRFNSGVILNNVKYVFPYSDGSATGKVLKTDGNGNLVWSTDNNDGGSGLSFAQASSYFVDDTGDTMTGALIINVGGATTMGFKTDGTISASGTILSQGALSGETLK